MPDDHKPYLPRKCLPSGDVPFLPILHVHLPHFYHPTSDFRVLYISEFRSILALISSICIHNFWITLSITFCITLLILLLHYTSLPAFVVLHFLYTRITYSFYVFVFFLNKTSPTHQGLEVQNPCPGAQLQLKMSTFMYAYRLLVYFQLLCVLHPYTRLPSYWLIGYG